MQVPFFPHPSGARITTLLVLPEKEGIAHISASSIRDCVVELVLASKSSFPSLSSWAQLASSVICTSGVLAAPKGPRLMIYKYRACVPFLHLLTRQMRCGWGEQSTYFTHATHLPINTAAQPPPRDPTIRTLARVRNRLVLGILSQVSNPSSTKLDRDPWLLYQP